MTYMPYMYALYVCLICMPYMYALYAGGDESGVGKCLICMPYMYALYAGGDESGVDKQALLRGAALDRGRLCLSLRLASVEVCSIECVLLL